MEFIVALFDLLKSIAWPIVAVIFVIHYKSEVIKDILPRLRKAGPAGIELDAAEQQKKLENDIIANSADIRKIHLHEPTPAIAQVESRLFNEIKTLNNENKIPLLIRGLAIAQLVGAFERLYRVLFGSQIIGLRKLNESYKIPVSEAREFFETYRVQYPDFYTSGFEGWLGFMKSQELVRELDGMLEITDIGQDFLLYITKNRLPEDKAF